MAQNGKIEDIKEFHKDNTVHFELSIPDIKKYSDQDIEKEFKLSANLSCSNFVLFDKDYKIRKYQNECEILEEFYFYRYEMYEKRKADMLKRWGQALEKLSNQHRFISEIISGDLKIFNKKKAQIVEILKNSDFKTYADIYP